MWEHGLDRAGSGQKQVAGKCECCNEPSGSIQSGEFLDQLRNGQLLKNDCALWNKEVKLQNNSDFLIVYPANKSLQRLKSPGFINAYYLKRIFFCAYSAINKYGTFDAHLRLLLNLMSFCIANCPQLLTKRVLHTEQFSASSFNFQKLFFSLRTSSICLRLLPRLFVNSVFPLTIRFRKHFLRMM